MAQINGRISQIIGPVVDVYFDTAGQDSEKVLPKIHDALKISRPNGKELIVEVQQHIGEDTVRCVAMDNTDGLQRGLEVIQTGSPFGEIYFTSNVFNALLFSPNLQRSSLAVAYCSNSLHSEHNSLLPSFFLQYKRIICSTTCCSSSILFISCLLRR